MLRLIDIFFLLFHSFLILFNLFGWIWKKTRKINLFTLLITLASWIGLGFFYGWGYCFLTDWHWRVLEKMGQTNLPNSYISYLVDRLVGIDLSGISANYLTTMLFILAFLTSIYVNFIKKLKI